MTVDEPEEARITKKKARLEYEIICDPKGGLMDVFGLRHEKAAPGGVDIPRSASILLGPDGEVLWAHVAENYRVRPKPEEIVHEVKQSLGNP